MATDTTKTETEKAGTAPETPQDKASTADVPAQQRTDADEAPADVVVEEDDDLDLDADEHRDAASVLRGGWGAGAAAVVSAGLGLSSLTGTSLSEMLRDRKQLIGQIESSAQGQSGGGGGADQISALYGAPWHATALFNGIFALLAVVVGGVLLALVSKRADTRSWVKALALGGLILGVLGLLVAGGMYLDVFASPPKVPGAPS